MVVLALSSLGLTACAPAVSIDQATAVCTAETDDAQARGAACAYAQLMMMEDRLQVGESSATLCTGVGSDGGSCSGGELFSFSIVVSADRRTVCVTEDDQQVSLQTEAQSDSVRFFRAPDCVDEIGGLDRESLDVVPGSEPEVATIAHLIRQHL